MRSPVRCLPSFVLAASVLVLASCGGDKPATTPPRTASPSTAPVAPATAAPMATDTTAPDGAAAPAGVPGAAAIAEAEQMFTARCALCHGSDGKGTGPGAASLNPKPRDYSDAAWQATVTDEELEKIILMGGSALGKSPLMPPNPDLAAKPEVVQALRLKVRAFATPAATP